MCHCQWLLTYHTSTITFQDTRNKTSNWYFFYYPAHCCHGNTTRWLPWRHKGLVTMDTHLKRENNEIKLVTRDQNTNVTFVNPIHTKLRETNSSLGSLNSSLRPANINCMFYLSSRVYFAKNREKIHTTKKYTKRTTIKFVYFWNVWVFFACAHIALGKKSEVKHTIYVGWPK